MFAVINYTCPGDGDANVQVVSITPEQVEDCNWGSSCTGYCPIGVYNNIVCAEKVAKSARKRTNKHICQNDGYY